MEEWKQFQSTRYEVSTHGRVRNTRTGRFVARSTPGGYKKFHCAEIKKDVLVHRAVMITFIPNPDNKPHVDHINRLRDDNRVENLRWATTVENNNNRCNVFDAEAEHNWYLAEIERYSQMDPYKLQEEQGS